MLFLMIFFNIFVFKYLVFIFNYPIPDSFYGTVTVSRLLRNCGSWVGKKISITPF